MSGAAAGSADRLSVLYVCDFASIHARGFIEAVARRGDIDVTVMTSRAAPPMPNVRVLPMFGRPGRPRPAWLLAFADWGRARLDRYPALLRKAWAREVEREAALLEKRLMSIGGGEQPQVIHAFRLLPEGLATLALAHQRPDTPLAASIWGQDLVYFANGSPKLGEWTRRLLQRVDILLPDTARDMTLARDGFGLPPTTAVRVLPGPGGIDVAALEAQMALPRQVMQGAPAITCFRAWTADTFSAAYLLDALPRVLEAHPAAHLHMVVPNRPQRVMDVRRRMRRLHIEDAVTLRVGHVSHAEVIGAMRGSAVNVLIGATDGLPMTMLESLYCGQVQVALNRSSYIPPLVAGRNAAFFDRIDGAAVADAILRATELAHTRPDASLDERRMLAAQYSRETGIGSIVEMYRRAVTERARAAIGGAATCN